MLHRLADACSRLDYMAKPILLRDCVSPENRNIFRSLQAQRFLGQYIIVSASTIHQSEAEWLQVLIEVGHRLSWWFLDIFFFWLCSTHLFFMAYLLSLQHSLDIQIEKLEKVHQSTNQWHFKLEHLLQDKSSCNDSRVLEAIICHSTTEVGHSETKQYLATEEDINCWPFHREARVISKGNEVLLWYTDVVSLCSYAKYVCIASCFVTVPNGSLDEFLRWFQIRY